MSAVLGLSNAAKMTVNPKVANRAGVSCLGTAAPTGQCAPTFDSPSIQAFYDAGGTASATGTTIAVIAEGDVSMTVSDLQVPLFYAN